MNSPQTNADQPQPRNNAEKLPAPPVACPSKWRLSQVNIDSIRRWQAQCRDSSIHIEIEGNMVTVEGITGAELGALVHRFELFGLDDPDAERHFWHQLAGVFPVGAPGKKTTKCQRQAGGRALMALLRQMPSRDAVEGLLKVQMLAAENLALEAMRRATQAMHLPEVCTQYVSCAAKMMRSYAALMGTLQKYRCGGRQQVTVEHVHVNQGGQAIVGRVETAARPPQEGLA